MTGFSTKPLRRVALAAGEPSGDLLGSLLLQGLHQVLPSDVRYGGVGGPKMLAQGFSSGWPMDTLSVNGYVEVLPKLPGILRLRRELIAAQLASPPLAFIGIDAPDFNLGVELKLRDAGIPVVHFVSPSIWAWRGERIHQIGRAADHVLCLFPFEPEIYHRAGIAATYVGHPLADEIPLQPDTDAARATLGVPAGVPLVAVLPGSRSSEVQRLGALFLQAMAQLAARRKDLHLVIPAATPTLRALLEPMLAAYPQLNATLIDGQSHRALEAADAVLLASGTATLEAALYKKPMVISYRVPWLTAQIMKRKGYLPYVGLPNILSGRFVVPELLQDAATPEALVEAVEFQLTDADNRTRLERHFAELQKTLRRNTASVAAQVVLRLLRNHRRL